MHTKSRIKDLCRISLFTVLICICTWIYVPFPLPFTMQTFAIFCALFCLGGKKGTISVAVYILMGISGLPVFSGFSSGVGTLLSSSGGFILGFLLSGVVYMLLESFSRHTITNAFISMIICYITGSAWFFFVYSESRTLQDFITCMSVCVVPFIVPDITKILLAYYISHRIKKHI